jgi:hypothetical protein
MNPNELPPSAVLNQMLWGKAVSVSLSALAKLGVADLMESEPVSAEYLAEKTGAHAPSLYRVMRMIASLGVFTELPGRLFTLTPVGRCLRADAPDSLRALAIMIGDEFHIRAHEKLLHCVRTGGDAITAAYGKNVFELLQEEPEQAENFQRCMTAYSRMEVALLDPVMDFSGFRRIADVGGGYGMLLGHILQKNPGLHGVLFDLPSVTAAARSAGHFQGCGDRIAFETGSMFEHVPAGCDAYIMKHIVHDWDDAHNHKILRLMCEQLALHAKDNGRVFLAEMIVPHGPEPSPAKLLDIEMLLMTIGGKERTVPEFSALFDDAGLELVGVKTTAGPITLIEARVAQ